MSDNLLRLEDLVNNPTARVPVCLCLDTSGSMRGDYLSELLGKSPSIAPIDELNEGVKLFYDTIRNDETALYSAEIAIVTFGDIEQLVEDFTNIERQPNVPTFTAYGGTPMGEAVNLALDRLEKRKQEYKDKGVDYFQPWLVLMTDGVPNGSQSKLEQAISRTQEMVDAKKLTVFPIGIGNNADMEVLAKFSPKRSPLKLKGTNFKEFFQWLSQSVTKTSQSMPGEKITLDMDGIKGWAEL
jgi:uncharacterized protein YegL